MIQNSISAAASEYWRNRSKVPGSFRDMDFLAFDRILSRQDATGDLLEIGVFLGKSAIVMGIHANGATVIANDVFDAAAGEDTANVDENAAQYAGLTRGAFLDNFRAHVGTEPRIVQAFSSSIRQHVGANSLRFAHIDGGHLYDQVRDDIANVRELLNDSGIIVFDDVRAVHTPGVAAAVWATVANEGLIPFCLTEAKLYATWSPDVAARCFEDLHDWMAGHPEVNSGVQHVHGHPVLIAADPMIWTKRRRIKSMVPPAVLHRLRAPKPPYLGEH